jgi:hypothetical protein
MGKKDERFPLDKVEQMFYDGCMEVGIDKGHAMVVSRAMRSTIWEIKGGCQVEKNIALGYIARLMRSMEITINLLPEF